MVSRDEEGENSSFIDKLKSFYYKLEDSYYAFLDKLHDSGIDLYKYFVEPIESNGIPSFPVAIALILIIIGALFFTFAGIAGPTGTLRVTVSAAGNIDDIPVTLLIDGNEFATERTSQGVATFSGVPLNKPAKIRVTDQRFAPVLQDVFLTDINGTITISLSSRTLETHEFLVTVLDASTQSPIRDALISFESLATGITGEATTQPDGTAVLTLDNLDSIISIDISAENFESAQRSVLASEGQLTVQLVSSTGGFEDGGDQPEKGTVIVRVSDNTGELTSARVDLFEEDTSTPIASDNVESGVVRFEEAAPIGTRVYVVVTPASEDFLSTQTTIAEITDIEDLEFSVQLQLATSETSQRISINVQGDDGLPVEFASVFLFSIDTNQLLSSGATEETGRAVFTIASNIPLEGIYVAVNAEEFLPLISFISSRDTTLELMPLAAGNNAEFDAEVLDADNLPASGAKVELADESGRLYGIQEYAGPSGRATFSSVPVDTSLRLFASLDGARGQSDVFEVAFSESGEKFVSVTLERPVGVIVVNAKNLIDGAPVNEAFIEAFANDPNGYSVANCTTGSDGSCVLENVWANKDIYLVASALDFEPSTSTAQFISPYQTKLLSVFLLDRQFKEQTIVNLVSLKDDEGKEILEYPAIERGRVYTARFAASFANSSTRQGIFLRVGNEPTSISDPVVIKNFEFTPSNIGAPFAVHSTTYSPGTDCNVDLLNSDLNNDGIKWIEVDYAGVSGVVELVARVFVKPTAEPASVKLTFNYRAFAVQNGQFSRNPYDEELGLEKKSALKDECYAQTIEKTFDLVEGSSVCNEQGTACIDVSFTSPQQPTPVGSPFIATINREFNVNFEIRSFGSVEGSSAFARIVSPTGLVQFSQYAGQGTATTSEDKKVVRVLLGEASGVYSGTVKASGLIPVDYAPLEVEFGDARGVVALNKRAFVVVQGTGALSVTQLTPTEFEVGKAKDLRVTVKTSAGEPITDATIEFYEENGSPFDGNVPQQIAGDNTPGNGEDGKYTVRRVRPVAPGTFTVTISRDRFVPVTRELTSKISNFFEFDQPDFISLSCNATTLRVQNTLDVEISADVYVDPTCVAVAGPGVTAQSVKGGQDGSSRYKIPNFRPGTTRLLQLSPNSGSSCQVEISATDPRTGTRSLDSPIQIENTCNAVASTNFSNADGVVYINQNIFQPPRLLVDTFSQYFYGSFQPQNYWDPRYADAASYSSVPIGGYSAFYQRTGVVDPFTGQPNQQYIDPRYQSMQPGFFGQQQGAVGVPRNVAYGGQYGRAGVADPYGGGAFFDISRTNFQNNWTLAWVNQDPIPHSFKCTNRAGDTIVQVDSLAPQGVHVQVISKPGLYKCQLENANKGTVKIKSMCPKKGALYYTRLITRCMARKAIGDSGLFDGGKQHAAKVAASVKTRFVAFASQFQIGQTSEDSKVVCGGSTGGAKCTLKITPLVPRNGFGFAIEDQTGAAPNYVIRLKPGGTIDSACFTYDELEKTSSFRALTQPAVSAISAIGLTSAPKFKSYAIKFNENGNCVKLRPVSGGGGRINFAPMIWNPREQKFLPGKGSAFFELQSAANPNVRYKLELEIEPDKLLDGRFLFTTIPTTVGENKLFYRTSESGDPREPGFVINNFPDEAVDILQKQNTGKAIQSKPGTIGVLDGNEPAAGDKLSSLATLKDGFYICAESGGCVPEGARAQLLTPFKAEKLEAAVVANELGDVIGNFKFEGDSTPAQVNNEDKPFVCSGVNYCTRATEATAVELAQTEVEKQIKEQYAYVETFNLDSSMDNMQDGLAGCIQEALAEIAAQEVQYQMCKTLAQFCGGVNYMDPEEEEIEEGESFASGVTLDAVLGDSKTIIKDIICQETEAGQNLQALQQCLQPGNRACRDMIAARIAGNLKQTQIESVAKEVPIVDIQNPVINFVTKRIQDNPKAAEANIEEDVTTGGYNVYRFELNQEDLISGKKDEREEGEVVFAVRPPGYDFSKAVAVLSRATAGAAFAPVRVPEWIYNWATSTAATPEGVRKVTLGFPFVVKDADKTQVVFDKFQPTLLTLNKYPVMRGVNNLARESKDDKTSAAINGNKCSADNRPVDPLDLFDACQDLRDESAQVAYDAKATNKKAPFARSLVFQAVPAPGAGDPLVPIWPEDYSQPFEVTMPPKYEFRSSGVTTSGVSAPLIASIPGLGRALYPSRDASKKFEKLTIPLEDIKKYAVQVTSCKYARNALQNNKIILDASVENNCNSLQWPIGMLFAGSNGNELLLGAEKCDGRQACVAVQLIGNDLRVAVVDGVYGAVTGKPSSKLKASSGSVELEEVARDLMRYYTDEAHVPATLISVLGNTANKCTLKATPNSVLLRCGESAEDTSKPVVISLDLARKFVASSGQQGGFRIKDATNVLAVDFSVSAKPFVIVFYKGDKKPKCFTSTSLGQACDLVLNRTSVEVVQLLPEPSTLMTVDVQDKDAYILFGSLVGDDEIEKLAGFKKKDGQVVQDFEISYDEGIEITAGDESNLHVLRTIVKSMAPLQEERTEVFSTYLASGQSEKFTEEGISELTFSTAVTANPSEKTAGVTLKLGRKNYVLTYHFGDRIARLLNDAIQASRLNVAGATQLTALRNTIDDSSKLTKTTCTAGSQTYVTEVWPFPFAWNDLKNLETLELSAPRDSRISFTFPEAVISCATVFETPFVGKIEIAGYPDSNGEIVFDFTKAPVQNVAAPIGPGTCNARAVATVFAPSDATARIAYVVTLDKSNLNALQSGKLSGAKVEMTTPWDSQSLNLDLQTSIAGARFTASKLPLSEVTDPSPRSFSFTVKKNNEEVCSGTATPKPVEYFDDVTMVSYHASAGALGYFEYEYGQITAVVLPLPLGTAGSYLKYPLTKVGTNQYHFPRGVYVSFNRAILVNENEIEGWLDKRTATTP